MSYVFKRLYPYRSHDAAKSCYEIWVTRHVMRFARELDAEVYRRLRQFLVKTADEGKIQNTELYKNIGDGVSEFIYRTTRIYSFDDGRRVVLTHGYKGKHLDRSAGQKEMTRTIRNHYLAWIGGRK